MQRDPNSPRPRRTVLATAGLTASASVIAAALLGGQLAEREPVPAESSLAVTVAESGAAQDAQPEQETGDESGDEA